MKTLVLGLFCILVPFALHAQTSDSRRLNLNAKENRIAPVGEIPSYVKARVDSVTYDCLEYLCRKGRVNYDFLYRETYPVKKAEAAESIRDMYKLVRERENKGELQDSSLNTFSVNLLPKVWNDTLQWVRELQYVIDKDCRFCKQKGFVYAADDAAGDARLLLEVWYTYDAGKGEVNILRKRLSAVGACSIELPGVDFDAYPERDSDELNGEYACLFSYKDKQGVTKTLTLNAGFVLPLVD